MRRRLYSTAEVEIAAAAQWYEDHRAGLGDQFLNAVERAIDQAVATPGRWARLPLSNDNARYLSVPGFPYVVIFKVVVDEVAVLSVIHAARLK